MRFIGEMRLTIITTGTDEFSLVPLFEDEAVTRGEREEARFNLTGEDVPLDKCPRTIHLQRNSWPFFPLWQTLFQGFSIWYEPCILSSLLVFCPPNTRRYRVYFHQDAASSCNLTGRARHTSPCVMWLSSPARVKFVPFFKGRGIVFRMLGCR